ncbi:MAG: nitrilase-related carbon-nitrogen hydrolase [Anaerolineae bacterium]|nr:hypothetical protein [Anaerolineae bacterium]MDW8100063.1 nitrilase-related carbon-nitrogen hydrolase [Anaerolineae bacterium]
MEVSSTANRITVAAVQLTARPLLGEASLRAWLEPVVAEAAERGVDLVVLPAGTGLLLLPGPWVAPMAVEAAWAAFEHVGRELARRFHLHLVAGTALRATEDGLWHSACLFSPDGEVLLMQSQTHHAPGEPAPWMLADRLETVTIGPTRIGLVVDGDVCYPEVSRILKLQGANLLLHPSTRRWPAAGWRAGLWREVQANQTFGVESPLIGEIWGRSAMGRAIIHAPIGVPGAPGGILAMGPTEPTSAVVVAQLDFEALARTIAAYPIFEVVNPRLYHRYFLRVYEEAQP